MKNSSQKIAELFNSNKIEEAFLLAEQVILEIPDDVFAHLILGKIYIKKQEWGKAINQFHKVLEFDGQHVEAQSQLDMANTILGYYTPDMFNP